MKKSEGRKRANEKAELLRSMLEAMTGKKITMTTVKSSDTIEIKEKKKEKKRE